MAEHGRLDVLVTSAGVQARGTLEQLDVATLRACLDVNVVGTWLAQGPAGNFTVSGQLGGLNVGVLVPEA